MFPQMAMLSAAAFGAYLILKNPSLSKRRILALRAVNEVVPSIYGSQKFALLAPGYDPSIILQKYPTFTTCGYLPGYVARKLGGTKNNAAKIDLIASTGLEALRQAAKIYGAWETLDMGKLPRSGDFLGFCDSPNEILIHVDVLILRRGNTWTTADAGQGMKYVQEAKFIDRKFNSKNGSITSPGGKSKLIAGWVNIDKYPFTV